jgi:hypothetical protein
MATASGSTITIYQGETVDIAFAVVDGDGAAYSLTGGEAVLTYKGTDSAEDITCSIDTSTVTASFTHAVTQVLSGRYDYQLMCKNTASQIVMVKTGKIEVRTALNPDAVS